MAAHFIGFSPVAAQTLSADAASRASEIQRRQEQELDAQRARAAERPDVLSAPATSVPGEGPLAFPAESPCFTLGQVIWDGPEPPGWLRRESEAALGPCVGGEGLRLLQEHLMAGLIDRGWITARLPVPGLMMMSDSPSSGPGATSMVASAWPARRRMFSRAWSRSRWLTSPPGQVGKAVRHQPGAPSLLTPEMRPGT